MPSNLGHWWDLGLRLVVALATGLGVWLVGYIIARILRRRLSRVNPGLGALVSRTLKIGAACLAVFMVVVSMGFSWRGALTSAGVVGTILTILVTFSAQASISNIFSGVFILVEHPFQEGDAIQVGENVGIVQKIGTLSTWIRTFDNIMLRIPNSQLLSSVIQNYTRYEVRRIETTVTIAYKEDPVRAIGTIKEALGPEPLFLARPQPVVIASSFGDYGFRVRVMVWIDNRDYFDSVSRLVEVVKNALDQAGIAIASPPAVLRHEP